MTHCDFTYGNKNGLEIFNKVIESTQHLLALSKCSIKVAIPSPPTLPIPDLCQMMMHESMTNLGWLLQNPRFKFHPRGISFWTTVTLEEDGSVVLNHKSISSRPADGTTSIQEQSRCILKFPFQRDNDMINYFPWRFPTPISSKPAWYGVGARDSHTSCFPSTLFCSQIPSQMSPVLS